MENVDNNKKFKWPDVNDISTNDPEMLLRFAKAVQQGLKLYSKSPEYDATRMLSLSNELSRILFSILRGKGTAVLSVEDCEKLANVYTNYRKDLDPQEEVIVQTADQIPASNASSQEKAILDNFASQITPLDSQDLVTTNIPAQSKVEDSGVTQPVESVLKTREPRPKSSITETIESHESNPLQDPKERKLVIDRMRELFESTEDLKDNSKHEILWTTDVNLRKRYLRNKRELQKILESNSDTELSSAQAEKLESKIELFSKHHHNLTKFIFDEKKSEPDLVNKPEKSAQDISREKWKYAHSAMQSAQADYLSPKYAQLQKDIENFSFKGMSPAVAREMEGRLEGMKDEADAIMRRYYSAKERLEKLPAPDIQETSSATDAEATLNSTTNTAQESGEPTQYQERLAIRNEWKQKKEKFETAYVDYLKNLKVERDGRSYRRKLAFWKKDTQPETLQQLDSQYTEARRMYANSLDVALASRITPKISGNEKILSGLRAGLANRFVLRAAHDRLDIERGVVLDKTKLRILEKIDTILKQNSRNALGENIRMIIASTTLTGGMHAILHILRGNFEAAKFGYGGGLMGSVFGGVIGGSIVARRQSQLKNSIQRARMSFSPESLDVLEKDYLKRDRAIENSIDHQQIWSLGGGMVGSMLGSSLAASLDVDSVGQTQPPLDVFPESNISPIPEVLVRPDSPLDVIPSTPKDTMPDSVIVISPESGLGANPTEQGPSAKSEILPQANNELSVPPVESTTPETVIPIDFSHSFILEGVPSTDTVSEQLYDAWKAGDLKHIEGVPAYGEISGQEFRERVWSALDGMNSDDIKEMRIESGDFTKMPVGDEYDAGPLLERMFSPEITDIEQSPFAPKISVPPESRPTVLDEVHTKLHPSAGQSVNRPHLASVPNYATGINV